MEVPWKTLHLNDAHHIRFTEAIVQMRNVKFVNCFFRFPTTEAPGLYLRQAGQQLLASDLNNARLNVR
jgi:hypothetical protein